ncbi:MAG: hypothetical protein HZB91_02440 [Elusimicrobia bacterium]|nr:hypothetical protein [Elusimicrobiota bacterium]
MGSQGFVLLYPDAATEALFVEFLSGLGPSRRKTVMNAILRLEDSPRPRDNAALNYCEVQPEALKVFLRLLPGIPVEKGQPSAYLDYLRARHRVTVEDVTVIYAIDDAKRYVWLMAVREAAPEELPS